MIPKGIHYVIRHEWQPKPWPEGYTTKGWYFEDGETLRGPYLDLESAVAAAEEAVRRQGETQ
jgi:hypothetical protein